MPSAARLDTSSSRSKDQALEQLLARTEVRKVLVATGAGISAESGIPTYRGEDGYWTETSANYRPQATGYLSYFRDHPRECWTHALRHRATIRAAAPNRAHAALAALEQLYGDEFLLVTQNVDGLHLTAGNTPERTIEAHGDIRHMRALDGSGPLLPVPEGITEPRPGELLDPASFALLVTPEGQLTRPHAMYFDEPYDEALYRSDTAMAAAKACDLLIVVGTSGATAIPWHLAIHAREADAAILVVDPQETPFTVHAHNRERAGKGLWLPGLGTEWVPRIVERLRANYGQPAAVPAPPPKSRRERRPKPRPGLSLVARRSAKTPGFEHAKALAELLAAHQPERVLVLTGAGISTESGIPSYRGPEGIWTLRGSDPISIADFRRDPRGIWTENLRRRKQRQGASPSAAHRALATLEQGLGDDFCLVTQNIDGLHLRAGNSVARTIELHGSGDHMRALEPEDHGPSDPMPIPLPAGAYLDPEAELDDALWAALTMPDGTRARPHVLLWDESYNEVQYRSESALDAARECDLLITIGTSGAAAMPYAIAAEAVLGADAVLIDINPEDNPYAEHARARAEGPEARGLWLPGPASEWVPELVEQLLAVRRA